MSDQQDSAEQPSAATPPEKDIILELNFVPVWARRPPGSIAGQDVEVREPRRERDFDRRGGGPRHGRPPHRGGGGRRDRDERGPRRDRGDRFDRGDRGGDRGRPGRRPDGDRDMPHREYLPLSIRFFPEQKQLSSLIRQMHSLKRAYPMMELVSIFLAKPELCGVRIEVRNDAPQGTSLYQCTVCGMVAMAREAAQNHVVESHVEEHFDIETVTGEPPTGQFSCVAVCGLSGTVLGPPNHHSYAERLQEVHRTRYPHLTLEEYRSRAEIKHDPALVDQWREQSRTQKRYRLKKRAPGDDEPLKWSAVESYMLGKVAPSVIVGKRKATVPVALTRTMRDRALVNAIRDAWRRESRQPFSLLFSMKGAFRHWKLHLFKAGRGIDFVSAILPSPLNPDHVIDSIREVLTYLTAHPGCTRDQLVAALRPGQPPDSPEVAKVLSPLGWLIEKGHILEFFDGTLSVPLAGRAPAPAAAPQPVQEA